MPKTKRNKYEYEITLKSKELPVVRIEAGYAGVDARGTIFFTAGQGGYAPSVIAAFAPGSWLSVRRVKKLETEVEEESNAP